MKTSQDGWMMNLFCFTLDGSTDSLYEPTQTIQKSQDPLRSPKMPSTKSRAVWRGSEPCIATASASTCREAQKLHVNEIHLEKARRKSQAITALDEATGSHDIHYPTNKEKDALVHSTNDSNTVTLKDQCRSKLFTKEEEDESVCSVKTGKDSSIQGVNFEAWNPNRENCDSKHQDKSTEGEEEGHGTLKRIHKLVGVKKGTQCDIEESRNNPNNRGQGTESESKHHSPVITCISMTKKPEKKLTKGPTPQPRQSHYPHQRKEAEIETEASWSPLLQESWSPMIYSPAWDTSTHTCHRSAGEQVMYNFNFTLPRDTDRERYEELFHRLDPNKREPQMRWITHSVMDLDVPDHLRSTSFGIFDRQHPTHDKAEDKKDNPPVEAESHEVDSGKTGSLGKKMKNISLTMRKKMGRKYTKALSEETGEEPASGEAGDGSALAKYNSQSSNSVESLFSLHSGQSSSSGVTSSSDGYSNRDSLRLDDDVPYTGQFCGRAKVHTDFVPSPYDTESLKLKVGDVIDIISKPAMGIWTGMLNNKVGSFKFIYVDVLVEESVPQPRIRSHRRSRRPRPKTLQEFLERLNLEEHISSLLLNGYQTVDDLRDLKEQHLIELNVTDPEHRHRLMAAAENLQDTEYNNQIPGQTNEEPKSPSEQAKEELKDCPRDSGCYIGSDCSENSKEDTENQLASHRPPTANP